MKTYSWPSIFAIFYLRGQKPRPQFFRLLGQGMTGQPGTLLFYLWEGVPGASVIRPDVGEKNATGLPVAFFGHGFCFLRAFLTFRFFRNLRLFRKSDGFWRQKCGSRELRSFLGTLNR